MIRFKDSFCTNQAKMTLKGLETDWEKMVNDFNREPLIWSSYCALAKGQIRMIKAIQQSYVGAESRR